MYKFDDYATFGLPQGNMEKQTTTIHVGPTPKSMSFSGCGFLGVYHIGVASCFQKHAPNLLKNMDKIYGCSAGSIMGAMLLNDICFGEVCKITLNIVKAARSHYLGPLSPGFKLNKLLMEGFRRGLPPDAHKRCNGKLFISLTRLRDGKNVIVSEYKSRQELMDVLICSSFVPFYSGFIPPTYRGVYYVDGGMSNNLPSDSDTITVSPWSGGSDICPKNEDAGSLLDLNIVNTSIQLSRANIHRCSTMFFPSKAEVLHDFCRQGFRETVVYLREHGLFETANPRPRSLSFSCNLHNARREYKSSCSFALESMPEETTAAFRSRYEPEQPDFEELTSRDLYAEYVNSDDVIDICVGDSISTDGDSVISESDSGCSELSALVSDRTKLSSAITFVELCPSHESSVVLQFNLPPPVIEALESFYCSYKEPSWRRPVGKLISLCRPYYHFALKIPLDRAYLISCILINKMYLLPDTVANLFNYVVSIVEWLQDEFRCKGDKLVAILKQKSNEKYLESVTIRFNIILQVVLYYLFKRNSSLL